MKPQNARISRRERRTEWERQARRQHLAAVPSAQAFAAADSALAQVVNEAAEVTYLAALLRDRDPDTVAQACGDGTPYEVALEAADYAVTDMWRRVEQVERKCAA